LTAERRRARKRPSRGPSRTLIGWIYSAASITRHFKPSVLLIAEGYRRSDRHFADDRDLASSNRQAWSEMGTTRDPSRKPAATSFNLINAALNQMFHANTLIRLRAIANGKPCKDRGGIPTLGSKQLVLGVV